MAIKQIKNTVWVNDKGVELIKLKPGSPDMAYVIVATCSADQLRDLAEAAAEASEALDMIAETAAAGGA